LSADSPVASVIWKKRSLNAPFTRHSTFERAPLRTAPSIRPVADDALM
jgi:hypothetical protein